MSVMSFDQLPYPLSAFHLISENAAREVRWHQKAPDALIGMTILTVKAIACQGVADVAIPLSGALPVTSGKFKEEMNDSQSLRLVPLTLNSIGIADSGERKTSVDRVVAAPVYAHDEDRAKKHESNMANYVADLSVWQSIERGLRRKLTKLAQNGEPTDDVILDLKQHALKKPTQPRLRRIIRRDITARAIAEVLHGDGESMALMSDEGDILLRGEAMKHHSWLNSVWDGSSLPLDRADGKSYLARNPRVTTSLMVQPSAFRAFMDRNGNEARGLGYFARFLIGWPMTTQGQRFISGQEGTWKHLPIFHARVKELLEEYDRRVAMGTPKRDVIHFSEEAKAHWISLVNDIEQWIQIDGALHDIKDAAAKGGEIVARVAGILHYFSGQVGGITVDTLERAITIVDWHVREFQRLMVPSNDVPPALKDAETLRKYFYRIQQDRLISNRDTRNSYKDPDCIERSEARHCGPLRKGRFVPALEILVTRGVVWVDYFHTNTRLSFRRPSGPLYIFYSDRLRYPLQL